MPKEQDLQKVLSRALRSYAKEQVKAQERKEERKKKASNPRSRYFAFVLYPDNSAQMQWLDYLKEREHIIYILHSPETPAVDCGNLLSIQGMDDPPHDYKPHYHCMIRFYNPHYLSGFIKSSCGAIKHAEAVQDIYSYSRYMIHDTYECLKLHKKEYSAADVMYSDVDFWAQCFCTESAESSVATFGQLAQIAQNCTSYQELCLTVASLGRGDLLKYIEGHAYHVKLCFFSLPYGGSTRKE